VRRALLIAEKDLRLLVRDKGALFWACAFPLAFALLFGAIFPAASSDRKIDVALTDLDGGPAARALVKGLSETPGVLVRPLGSAEAEARVRRGDSVAVVQIPAGYGQGPTPLHLGVDPSRSVETAWLEAALTRGSAAGCPTAVNIERSVVAHSVPHSGFELAFPAAVLWGLIGCAGAFAAATVAERRSGTHLRLRASPIHWSSMLLGKLLACVVACAVDATALLLIARFAFGVRVENFASLPLAIACCAICFGGITVLLGVVGRSEQAVGGASWATLLLMAMVGGAMVPVSVMPSWMRVVSTLSPVRWGIVALEGATFRGLTLLELAPAFGTLLAFGCGSLLCGALLSRRLA
jgi:ABC-2 type transport system permease protein